MTTSKSPSSLSDPAFTLEPVGTAGLFGMGASLAVLAAVNAGGGIGFPWASSCRNAQAGFVQFRYLHSNRDGPAVSPVCQLFPCSCILKDCGGHTQNSCGADVRFRTFRIFTFLSLLTRFLTQNHPTLFVRNRRWMRVWASRITTSNGISTKSFRGWFLGNRAGGGRWFGSYG
jgi:hypothetical protein